MNWLLRLTGKAFDMRHASFFMDSFLPNSILTIDLVWSTQVYYRK